MREAYWLSIDENDAPIVISYLKEIGIKAEPLSGEKESFQKKDRCGSGFGDFVWRVNCDQNRIEASFAKPCETSRILKSNGFRWIHAEGIWVIPNFDVYAELLESLGLRQVDPVVARKK